MADAELQIHESTLHLQGSVNFDNVMRLQREGVAFIKQHPRSELLCNLSGVHYRDSAILPLLTAWRRYALRQETKLTYAKVPVTLQRIGEVCGLGALWTN